MSSLRRRGVSAQSGEAIQGIRSRCHEYVCGYSDGKVLLWCQRPYLRPLELVACGSPVTHVDISGCGQWLLVTSSDRVIRLCDIRRKTECHTFQGHTRIVRSARWGSSGLLFITSSDDKSVKFWSYEGRLARFKGSLLGHTNWVMSASLQPGLNPSQAVSCGNDRSVRVWDLHSKESVMAFFDHSDHVTDCCYVPGLSSDGSVVASGSRDRSLRLWDARAGHMVQYYLNHKGPITSLSVHNSGNYVVSSSEDGTINLTDIRAGRILWDTHTQTGAITSVRFEGGRTQSSLLESSCGTYLSTCTDGTLTLWA